jgi:hypothetical protein
MVHQTSLLAPPCSYKRDSVNEPDLYSKEQGHTESSLRKAKLLFLSILRAKRDFIITSHKWSISWQHLWHFKFRSRSLKMMKYPYFVQSISPSRIWGFKLTWAQAYLSTKWRHWFSLYVYSKKIWKQSDPLEALITTWVYTWGKMKMCNIPHAPVALAWVVFNSQHFIVPASKIPKDHKNTTTLKWSTGQHFTAARQHLTPAVVKYTNLETKWSLRSIYHKKIVDSVWLSLYRRENEYVQYSSRPLAPAWVVLNSQHLIVPYIVFL